MGNRIYSMMSEEFYVPESIRSFIDTYEASESILIIGTIETVTITY